jgi:hypothetical protein
MSLRFEWDKNKTTSNLRKHKVGFEAAITVFDDAPAVILDDDDHSDQERREIIIGHSGLGRLGVVCFTEREPDTVRIISARGATGKEQNGYEENIKPTDR